MLQIRIRTIKAENTKDFYWMKAYIYNTLKNSKKQ